MPISDVCDRIGQYWNLPQTATVQPHNLIGHAFRSVLVECLQTFGDPAISYEEEIDPRKEFPGFDFGTRSKAARIDIIGRRKGQLVAMISSRWRFRHDRVEVVEEALAYMTAARRTYGNCQFYAWLGEFSAARLEKVLTNCPPYRSNAALAATVHFQPRLISEGLGENGRLAHLKSLSWLIDQTFTWK